MEGKCVAWMRDKKIILSQRIKYNSRVIIRQVKGKKIDDISHVKNKIHKTKTSFNVSLFRFITNNSAEDENGNMHLFWLRLSLQFACRKQLFTIRKQKKH